MNIDDTLEAMDEILDKAMQVPFSGKKGLIDVGMMRSLIEDIRMSMPDEIKQAQNLVNDRKIIISDAKNEAERIIKKAEEKAEKMVSQEEITRQANERANEIIHEAQTKYNEFRVSTNEYVDSMLTRVEELLTKDVAEVKKARSVLKSEKK